MNRTYIIDIQELFKQFSSEIRSVNNHNYDIKHIFQMIFDTFTASNNEAVLKIGRWCMDYSPDPETSVRDSQILLTAIMSMRNEFFHLFGLYKIVDVNNPDCPFCRKINFTSFHMNTLTVEVIDL